MSTYQSWGHRPITRQEAIRPSWSDFTPTTSGDSLLPYGRGLSYGDSCLNSSGKIIDCRFLNKFISFDSDAGVIRCESGITFSDILEVVVPCGWFPPVTPGTKYVTLGGAIANDIHGKNHHREGTFGRHVRCFELLRSNGERLLCSPERNKSLFCATIGGLGLTGIISWAEIQLIPVTSPDIDVQTFPFKGLQEFCDLSEQAGSNHQYTVAWLDCASRGKNFGRGLFTQANHSNRENIADTVNREYRLSVPFNFPKFTVNRCSVTAFNSVYFRTQKKNAGMRVLKHFEEFLYPLDRIKNWNRIYGRDGFYQYQFVIPSAEIKLMEKILDTIIQSGLGSFLAVLKKFEEHESPGLMSFPRPGICLALDFSNRGKTTSQLLFDLDTLVMSAGGCVYPAKDKRMSSKAFKSYFPSHELFTEFIDPKFTSDFWARVHDTT